jgi:hypothetical protein
MGGIRHTIEEINEFYEKVDGCADGREILKSEGIYGIEPKDTIPELRRRGFTEEAAWTKLVTKTEAYVRWNGREITMGAYQVFNTLTGQHIKCETEEELKLTMTNIAQQILDSQIINVCQELRNENGDSVWLPHKVEIPYVVVQKP